MGLFKKTRSFNLTSMSFFFFRTTLVLEVRIFKILTTLKQLKSSVLTYSYQPELGVELERFHFLTNVKTQQKLYFYIQSCKNLCENMYNKRNHTSGQRSQTILLWIISPEVATSGFLQNKRLKNWVIFFRGILTTSNITKYS